MGGSSGLPARVDRDTCTRWARRLPAPAPVRSSSSSSSLPSPSPSRSPFVADGASAALVRAMRLRSGDVDNRFVRCLAHRRLLFVVYAPPLPLHLPFSSGSDAPFLLPFPPHRHFLFPISAPLRVRVMLCRPARRPSARASGVSIGYRSPPASILPSSICPSLFCASRLPRVRFRSSLDGWMGVWLDGWSGAGARAWVFY